MCFNSYSGRGVGTRKTHELIRRIVDDGGWGRGTKIETKELKAVSGKRCFQITVERLVGGGFIKTTFGVSEEDVDFLFASATKPSGKRIRRGTRDDKDPFVIAVELVGTHLFRIEVNHALYYERSHRNADPRAPKPAETCLVLTKEDVEFVFGISIETPPEDSGSEVRVSREVFDPSHR